MPHSKAEAATSATAAGEPAAAKSRARPRRRGAKDVSAPRSGVTITRWSFGISLSLAVAILGGAYQLQWDRMTRIEAEVRNTRVELWAEIGVLRAEMRQEIGIVREEIGGLRAEMRQEIGAVREEIGGLRAEMRQDFRELAALIRARDAGGTGAE